MPTVKSICKRMPEPDTRRSLSCHTAYHSKPLYLPKGCRVDQKTKQVVEGGRWLRTCPAPLDTLPVFVREGAKR